MGERNAQTPLSLGDLRTLNIINRVLHYKRILLLDHTITGISTPSHFSYLSLSTIRLFLHLHSSISAANSSTLPRIFE
jgi:hypothetical protein